LTSKNLTILFSWYFLVQGIAPPHQQKVKRKRDASSFFCISQQTGRRFAWFLLGLFILFWYLVVEYSIFTL